MDKVIGWYSKYKVYLMDDVKLVECTECDGEQNG